MLAGDHVVGNGKQVGCKRAVTPRKRRYFFCAGCDAVGRAPGAAPLGGGVSFDAGVEDEP